MIETVIIEYQRIGLLPTCLGNERLRILADGRVDHSVNSRECEAGGRWSSNWQEAGRLDGTALARLLAAISDSGLLSLPPAMIDEDVDGGKREELRLHIDGADHCFVVQNCDPPALRAVVRLLWDALAAAGLSRPAWSGVSFKAA
jgi:hypothetical protein